MESAGVAGGVVSTMTARVLVAPSTLKATLVEPSGKVSMSDQSPSVSAVVEAFAEPNAALTISFGVVVPVKVTVVVKK